MGGEKKHIKNSRCLVAGGSGFIGARVVDMLLDMGAKEVVILGRVDGSIQDRRVHYRSCDLTKDTSVEIIKNLGAFNYIFNLVGMTDNLMPHPHSMELFDANVRTLMNLTQGIVWKNVSGAVHTGSNMEYGNQSLPHREDMNPEPTDMYGWSKASASSYACTMTQAGLARWCVARPFFVYGPGKRTGFIPKLMETLSMGKTFMVAGKSTRDPICVDDVAMGLVRLVLCSSARGEIVNVCSGKEISIARIAEMAKQKIGKGKVIVSARARSRDILRSRGSVTKLKKLTGWSPSVPFSKGLESVVKEYKMRL